MNILFASFPAAPGSSTTATPLLDGTTTSTLNLTTSTPSHRPPLVNATLQYKLEVIDFTPKCGSTLGGTKIKVKGKGFCGNYTDTEVKIGEVKCKVEEVSENEIQCTTGTPTKVVSVDNNGKSPSTCEWLSIRKHSLNP